MDECPGTRARPGNPVFLCSLYEHECTYGRMKAALTWTLTLDMKLLRGKMGGEDDC